MAEDKCVTARQAEGETERGRCREGVRKRKKKKKPTERMTIAWFRFVWSVTLSLGADVRPQLESGFRL